jgi:hypothetical protein
MEGAYTVVKYVPQPERGESVNLGVVLVSGSEGIVWTHFRESSSFNRYPSYLRPNPDIVKSFEKQLNDIPKETGKADLSSLLQNLRHDLQNSIQTGEPHPCIFDDALTFLDSIYARLVAPPDVGKSKKKTSSTNSLSAP